MPQFEPSQQVSDAFEKRYGERPTGVYCAPGRVNLIGEHTDYNAGFVLPATIDFHAAIAASPRDDAIIEATALLYSESSRTESLPGGERVRINLRTVQQAQPQSSWADYLIGVVREVLARGYALQGMNLVISGNVPQGAGLSSSAAFEMALASAFKQVCALPMSGKEAALIGQAAENHFVGCQCGIMDQLVSALGKKGHAMLLDCRSLDITDVPIPEHWRVVIIDSTSRRELVSSEYNVRRKQCEAAAKQCGVNALRDATLEQLNATRQQLSDLAYRRARHVITENQRTLAASEALANQDMAVLSALMHESHVSMRDDFEITTEWIDYLVASINHTLGKAGGVRMTGGGFGGCVVAIAPESLVPKILSTLAEDAQLRVLKDKIYVCRPVDGGFVTLV